MHNKAHGQTKVDLFWSHSWQLWSRSINWTHSRAYSFSLHGTTLGSPVVKGNVLIFFLRLYQSLDESLNCEFHNWRFICSPHPSSAPAPFPLRHKTYISTHIFLGLILSQLLGGVKGSYSWWLNSCRAATAVDEGVSASECPVTHTHVHTHSHTPGIHSEMHAEEHMSKYLSVLVSTSTLNANILTDNKHTHTHTQTRA